MEKNKNVGGVHLAEQVMYCIIQLERKQQHSGAITNAFVLQGVKVLPMSNHRSVFSCNLCICLPHKYMSFKDILVIHILKWKTLSLQKFDAEMVCCMCIQKTF